MCDRCGTDDHVIVCRNYVNHVYLAYSNGWICYRNIKLSCIPTPGRGTYAQYIRAQYGGFNVTFLSMCGGFSMRKG